jgi:hypothetical protein
MSPPHDTGAPELPPPPCDDHREPVATTPNPTQREWAASQPRAVRAIALLTP